MKYGMTIAVSALALMTAGCTSIPPGATAVSADEIKRSMSGRTWSWDDGGPGAGMYFAPDGQAHGHWKGESWTTTWSTRDGAFCYKGENRDRCWALYVKDGTMYARSLWQSEYPNPWPFNPATEMRRGRHIS